MITCKELTEVITDYMEGRMSLWDRMMFQMHVGMCKNCREYLNQMKKTVRMLGTMPPEPPPKEVADELMERFKGWNRTRQ